MTTLADLRQRASLSPQQLAAAAGVPVATLQSIEAGRAGGIPLAVGQAIAGTLGVDASDVDEFRAMLGLRAVGETGSGEAARTGAAEPGPTGPAVLPKVASVAAPAERSEPAGPEQPYRGPETPGGELTGYERAREG